MRMSRMKYLVKKDLLEVKEDKAMLSVMLIFPVIFSVLIPIGLMLFGQNKAILASVNGLQMFIEQIPAVSVPSNLDKDLTVIYAVLMYFLIPFFLLIPILISNVLASSSFVGEKEHHTLEGLLYTPLSDKELLFGKMLVAIIPAIVCTWGSIIVFGGIILALSKLLYGQFIFLNLNWLWIGVLLAPLLTFLSTALVIFVSQYVKTAKAAQSVSIIFIFPIIGMIISQSSGAMLFNRWIAFGIAAVLLVLDVICFRLIVRTFNRERYILGN